MDCALNNAGIRVAMHPKGCTPDGGILKDMGRLKIYISYGELKR